MLVTEFDIHGVKKQLGVVICIVHFMVLSIVYPEVLVVGQNRGWDVFKTKKITSREHVL